MSDKRQKNQLTYSGNRVRDQQMVRACMQEDRGEAPKGLTAGTESRVAKRRTESPAMGEQVMEDVCGWENCKQAVARVKANKGSPGVEGLTVQQVPEHLNQQGPAIREQVLRGTYGPQPVKRVEIPKPDGGVRPRGIPTVLDRCIQQAVRQVLQRKWDRTFSEHRDGFRPGRSAHQAVAAAQQYLAAGYRWVGDLDLETCVDRVNHDKLMAKIAERVSDTRLLKLIRTCLTAGVRENGLASPVDEGTPPGGPLSPLLSNSMLDALDRELEPRGLRFARYADASNIDVRSRRAGERVMASLTRFITAKRTLKVNQQKRAGARPWERKFLGFSFTNARAPKRRIAPNAVDRFKERIRELTSRTRGVSMERMAEELAPYLRGWIGYFGQCDTPTVVERLEQWVRRRLRSAIWQQWKQGSVRFTALRQRGVGYDLAAQTAGCAHGPWRFANSPALACALPNAYFDSLGIPRLTGRRSLNPPNRRMRTRMSGGVTGKAGDSLPM